jgi:signal transduction histidine kinase
VKRLTIRLRLTALYGGLFFLAGAMMLGVTYLLVEANLDTRAPGPSDRVAQLREAAAQGRLPDGLPNQVDPDEWVAALEELEAAQERFRSETLESLLTQGGIALGAVGVGALGFGWLLAGRALAPVHQITDTARRIAAGSAGRGLHERIALAGPRDEIRELADTFDAMLERLDRSFDGQRRFVANASHEIRTPLALNRALVEVAMTRPGASDDVKQLGEALLAVNERHERLIDGLLTLAESENDIAERSPVDLADVAGHVLDRVVPASVHASRDLRPAPSAGDPILLERLVYNLVENAVRHNLPDGGWLTVSTGTADGRATLTVTNPGPVVTAYQIPVLFEPFRRSGPRAGGTVRGAGLGLSIVLAIARAHGGEVSARPRDGGGLIVTVSLPPPETLDPHAT